MMILLSWLNEYGDFGDPTKAEDVARVANALTSLGLEVDSVETVGETVPGVVSGWSSCWPWWNWNGSASCPCANFPRE